MTIMLFWNGNTAVLDDDGQHPALQQPWIVKFFEFLEAQGVDPAECRFHLPDGKTFARAFRTGTGWNWDLQ